MNLRTLRKLRAERRVLVSLLAHQFPMDDLILDWAIIARLRAMGEVRVAEIDAKIRQLTDRTMHQQ